MSRINTPHQIGELVRRTRLSRGLKQRELAHAAGVGNRFISDLEGGKATAELGKTLLVLATLQIELEANTHDTLARALHALKTHEPRLREQGVLHAGIFGSTARGEDGPNSDVDILVEYDRDRIRSLLDIAGVHTLLQEIIGRPVDVADRHRLKPQIAPSALEDVVNAF